MTGWGWVALTVVVFCGGFTGVVVASLVVEEVRHRRAMADQRSTRRIVRVLASGYKPGGVIKGPEGPSETSTPVQVSEGRGTQVRPGETPSQAMGRLLDGTDL
jgi:hypothetical protein